MHMLDKFLLVNVLLFSLAWISNPALSDRLIMRELNSSEIEVIKESLKAVEPSYSYWMIVGHVNSDSDVSRGKKTAFVIDRPVMTSERVCRTRMLPLTYVEGENNNWILNDAESLKRTLYFASVVDEKKTCENLSFEEDFFETPEAVEDFTLKKLYELSANKKDLIDWLRKSPIDLGVSESTEIVNNGVVRQISVTPFSFTSIKVRYVFSIGKKDRLISFYLSDSEGGLRIEEAKYTQL